MKITWLFFTARYLYKKVTKRCGVESLLIYREVRRGGAGGQQGGHGHHGPTGNGLALPCKYTHTNQKRERERQRALFTSRQLIWCLTGCICTARQCCGSGSGNRWTTRIISQPGSESLETIFRVKVLKFFGSGIWDGKNSDPGWKNSDPG